MCAEILLTWFPGWSDLEQSNACSFVHLLLAGTKEIDLAALPNHLSQPKLLG